MCTGYSPVVLWLRLHASNAGSLGSIPGQGTRSHKLQLRIHTLQLKILCAQRRVVAAARRRGRREEGTKRKERGSREERSLSPLMCGVEKEIPVSSR